MRISKKGWAYRMAYWFRSERPDSAGHLKFFFDFLFGSLFRAFLWLFVGITCFLFAWKPAKSTDKLLEKIEKWPEIFGHRIWPLSLIGLGFLIWPFVDFNSWRKYEIAMLITSFSAVIFFAIVSTTKTWEKISERTQIVFTENGKA